MSNIEKQPHIEGMSRRNILEQQDPAVLSALKAEMLNRLSDLERDVHLVNDVIDSYGRNDNIELGRE